MKNKPFCLLSLIVSLGAFSAPSQPSPGPPAVVPHERTTAAKPKHFAEASASEAKGASKLLTRDRAPKEPETFSSLDPADDRETQGLLPAGTLSFEDAEVAQVLKMYQNLSGRTLVRPSALPPVKISIQNQAPLTRREALQGLDSVLAQNGITMIPQGRKFVKAVPSAQAPLEAVALCELAPDQLPESSSYTFFIVELKSRRPSQMAPILQPLARMPTSIMAMDDSGMLILRDYSANVRRMLQVIERVERAPKPRAARDEQ